MVLNGVVGAAYWVGGQGALEETCPQLGSFLVASREANEAACSYALQRDLHGVFY